MRVGSGNVIKKKKREGSKKHKSKRCHCYTVIDITKNLKSYISLVIQTGCYDYGTWKDKGIMYATG